MLSLNLFLIHQMFSLTPFRQGLNFEEDWKLLTILMGMNDICDHCKDKVRLLFNKFSSTDQCLFKEGKMFIMNTCDVLSRLYFQWITSFTISPYPWKCS